MAPPALNNANTPYKDHTYLILLPKLSLILFTFIHQQLEKATHKIDMKFLKRIIKRIIKSHSLITLFTTTLGVLLAFYLNDLSLKHGIEKNKANAISNLKSEFKNNIKDLESVETNDSLLHFLNTIYDLNKDLTNSLTCSTEEIQKVKSDFPTSIEVLDSTLAGENKFTYTVAYDVEFHLHEIQNIAWETSKMSNITNEFNYVCLNRLVHIYKLQEFFIGEQQKLINYMVNEDYKKLHAALSINDQIRLQLLEATIEAEKKIDSCE